MLLKAVGPRPVKMGLVEIIRVPEGEPPRWVRASCVNLEFPCLPIMACRDRSERGVVSLEPPALVELLGFLLPQPEMIEVLRKEVPEAAAWWLEHGFPKAAPYDGVYIGRMDARIKWGVEAKKPCIVETEIGR